MTTDFLKNMRGLVRKIKDKGISDEAMRETVAAALHHRIQTMAEEGNPIEDGATVLAETIKTCTSHPLARRFLAYCAAEEERNSEMGYFITEAWMAQAERLFAMTTLATPEFLSLHPMYKGLVNQSPLAFDDTDIRAAIISQMKVAQVYLFTSDIMSKLSSMPVPRHTISPELMPHPIMYWTSERPLSVSTDPDDVKAETASDVDWILVSENIEGLTLTMPVGDVITTTALEFGKIWPDEYDHPEQWSMVLAVFAFLNSPFVDSSPVRLPRSSRREIEREAKHNPKISPDPLTHVVTLRTLSEGEGGSNRDGSVEHDHQWWVQGHIRAQWYPSKKSHKLIWIAPHLKGPSDKPIKTKTYVVKR